MAGVEQVSSKKPFRIAQTRCGCHPETCCCPDFTVLCGDEVVCGGSDRESMQALVDAANRATVENELFVQARDLLCKIAGETDPARMEVNAWEAMELSRKMRAADEPGEAQSLRDGALERFRSRVVADLLRTRIPKRAAEPPSLLQRERFIDEWARAAFAALLSLSNARVVELGQTKSAVREYQKAIKLASKKLPFRASKAIEQNLSYFCNSYAEAYMAGAEEAQSEIIARLRAELGKNAVEV